MDTALGITMARPRGRKKTSQRDDTAVKIDRAVVGQAKLIATFRGISLAELLSEMLKVPVSRAYAQMLRELEAKV